MGGEGCGGDDLLEILLWVMVMDEEEEKRLKEVDESEVA